MKAAADFLAMLPLGQAKNSPILVQSRLRVTRPVRKNFSRSGAMAMVSCPAATLMNKPCPAGMGRGVCWKTPMSEPLRTRGTWAITMNPDPEAAMDVGAYKRSLGNKFITDLFPLCTGFIYTR